MAITKMSIGVPPVKRFTVAARALSKCGRTPAIIAGLMETTMSKNTAAKSERELNEAELEQVSGGTPSIPIPPPAPNVTINGGPLGFVAPLHVARS